MTTLTLFRSIAIAMLIIWLPSSTFAAEKFIRSNEALNSSYQDRKQEPKKPVKEVPQSRKQDKPKEVKPGKSGKN